MIVGPWWLGYPGDCRVLVFGVPWPEQVSESGATEPEVDVVEACRNNTTQRKTGRTIECKNPSSSRCMI